MRPLTSWALALTCLLVPLARAQDTLSRDFAQQIVVSPYTLRQLKEVAGLDEAQQAAARQLFDAAFAEMSRRSRRYFRANVVRFADYGEPGDAEYQRAREEVEKSLNELIADQTRLERDLLNDWKALLTPAQAESWPRFERARRRLLLHRYSSVPDLTREAARLRILPEFAEPFTLALDAYERELDEILLDARKVYLTAATTDRQAFYKSIQTVSERIIETSVRHATALDRFFHPDDRGLLKARAMHSAPDYDFDFGLLSGFRDLRGITPEQLAAMDRLVLKAAAGFLAAAPEYADLRLRKETGGEVAAAAYDAARAKALTAARAIRRKIVADARAILTPAQLAAYDDGSDPAGVNITPMGE